MRWVLAGALVITSASSGLAQQPAAQPQLEVTLNEAIQRSLSVQPAMVAARGDQRNAGADKRMAYGAFIPSVSVGASAARSNVNRIDQTTGRPIPPEYTYTGTFSASLVLFDGLQRFTNLKASSASGNAADAGVVNQRFLTTLETKQLFYTAVANEALVRVADAQLKRAQQQLQISVQKLRAGSATRSDSLRSTVNLGSAQLALINALSDVARTQSTLGRTLGLETRVGAQDDSSFYNFTLGLDTAALQQEALARSPRVQAAEASARSADAALKASRSSYWPSLNLSGQTNWNAQSDFDYQMVGNRSVGLNLSWPLFDRFQREQTIANRQGSLDVAEANAADARREIQASLTTQFAALRAAQVRIDITRASVEAANEDLRVVNERYRVGAATILDVLNSQEALAQADVDAISARFDYLRAKAQIEALIGRIL